MWATDVHLSSSVTQFVLATCTLMLATRQYLERRYNWTCGAPFSLILFGGYDNRLPLNLWPIWANLPLLMLAHMQGPYEEKVSLKFDVSAWESCMIRELVTSQLIASLLDPCHIPTFDCRALWNRGVLCCWWSMRISGHWMTWLSPTCTPYILSSHISPLIGC